MNKVYQWTYRDCPWINEADVLADRKVMSFEEFKAEYLGEWGAKVGGVYIHEQIDDAVMELYTLQGILDQIETEAIEWHYGIDWGDVHLTAVIEGFEYQGELYETDCLTFDIERNKLKDDVLDEIVIFVKRRHHLHSNHIASVYSEAAPIATSDNHRLTTKLRGYGISLHSTGFGQVLDKEIDPKEQKGIRRVPKETFVQDSVSRFNHHTIHIYEKLTLLIKQLKSAVRTERGELEKGNDDVHDAHLHWVQSFARTKRVKYHRRSRA